MQNISETSTDLFSIALDDDRYLIYAPLYRAAFIADAEIANSHNKIIEFLRQHIDIEPEKPPITKLTGTVLPTAITLLLTTACNLRCSYCYASAGDTKLEFMSLDTAKRGIDFIAANAVKKNFIRENTVNKLDVAYHGGGEPSNNWAVLINSFAYAQKKAESIGLGVTGRLISNGVLPDSKIDWIINNMTQVTISFDGLPSIQDKQRATATGRGSSKSVMHTLRCFDAANFPYVIRITATEKYLDQLPEAVAFIQNNFKPLKIQIEPAYPIGRGFAQISVNTKRFITAYRKARAIANVKLHYSPLNLDKRSNHFCGITQDAFSLSPAGNVTACYSSFSEKDKLANVFFYGKADTNSRNYVFDMPKLNKLRNWAIEHQDFCSGCFAKWHCSGDCHYNSLSINDNEKFTGSERCYITRELIKDELLARIAASGKQYVLL